MVFDVCIFQHRPEKVRCFQNKHRDSWRFRTVFPWSLNSKKARIDSLPFSRLTSLMPHVKCWLFWRWYENFWTDGHQCNFWPLCKCLFGIFSFQWDWRRACLCFGPDNVINDREHQGLEWITFRTQGSSPVPAFLWAVTLLCFRWFFCPFLTAIWAFWGPGRHFIGWVTFWLDWKCLVSLMRQRPHYPWFPKKKGSRNLILCWIKSVSGVFVVYFCQAFSWFYY